MNRKQRRKTGAPKERTYVLKESELEAIKRQAADEAIRQYRRQIEVDVWDSALLMFLAIPAIVLKKTFKFGKQRNGVFLDRSLEMVVQVQEGNLSLDEIIAEAEIYTGYKFIKEDKS